MAQSQTSPIVEEFLVRPSQVAPTLFVGLGGAGCRLVNRIFKQLTRRSDFKERFKELAKFAYVDTNIHDLEKYREDGDDLFLISDFEKAEYSRLAAGKAYLDPDDYFTQWVPQNYRFRSGDTAGAGQIRIESRLGLYYQVKHKDFVQRFRRLIEQLKDHAHGHRRLDSAEIRIVLAYSVAGGTGSGSHLPMAYLLREIAEQFGKPLIFGVAALSSVFEDKVGANKDGVFANGYAALKETEYLMKLGAPESRFFPEDGRRTFHYNPADRSRRTVEAKPFEVLWVVDRPESFAVSDVLAAAGDAIFLQLYTPIYGEQAGDFDNYTQHQRFLVPYDFEAKGIPGYSSFYGALGAAVLHVPDRSLLRYCARRGGLAVIENSFLQGIPPGETYRRVADNAKPFFEIEALDRTGRVVRESDFDRRSADERLRLRNKLFQKRVRLLAAAEIEEDSEVDFFLRVFRHGHGLRAVPEADGSAKAIDPSAPVAASPNALRSLETFKSRISAEANKLQLSMAHFALNALSAVRGEPPWKSEAFERVLQELSDKLQEEGEAWGAERQSATVVNRGLKRLYAATDPAKTSATELTQTIEFFEKNARDRVGALLDRPELASPDGLDWAPGFAWLERLGFISSSDAMSTNLVEKRYAVLTVLDRVEALLEECSKEKKLREDAAEQSAEGERADLEAVAAAGGASASNEEWIDKGNILARTRGALDEALVRLEQQVFAEHYKRLEALAKTLSAFASVFTDLQEQFGALRKHEISEAEKLRVEGSKEDTDAFLLDGEALQIENGRRMWDFYFEDQIRSLGALHISSNEALAKVVSGTIERLAGGRMRGEATPGDALSKMYRQVSDEIESALRHKVQGDLRSTIETDRFGLTLRDALELEIKYRAIYLTNREKIDGAPPEAVGAVVGASRSERASIDVHAPVHYDYLRDKLKRLIKERSDLLCYLDEKHLSQGGVRPDEVFLAAVHEDLYGGLLKEVLNISLGVRPPKVITKDVEDRKQVVFYRAVLNVPLYVFGRMRELRECYHQFKALAKRSKVLHIDKNWEDTLPDLDPAAVEEEHRQQRIRDSVLDFATLLKVPLKLMFDSFVGEEGRRELLANAEAPEAWEADWLRLSGVDEGATCVHWREPTGRSGERPWVLRIPLEERIRRILVDRTDPSELDAEEPIIGSYLGEAVLRVQELVAESPERYRAYTETCASVREGKAPLVIQSLIRLPGTWRRHREGLKTRYGRSPTEAQQRTLEDLENVERKLTDALVQLYDVLDLRRREAGLRIDPIVLREELPAESRTKLSADEDPVVQSITLLYHFKNSLKAASTLVASADNRPRLFAPLHPDAVKRGLKR